MTESTRHTTDPQDVEQTEEAQRHRALERPSRVEAETPDTGPARSLTSDAWRHLRRSPLFWVSATLIVVLVLMAAVPSLFTTVDPNAADLSKARALPSSDAWFGRDFQGHDIFSRTVYGARASILVGVFTSLGTVIVGGVVGVLAAYNGGWLDSVISRIADVFFAIPLLLGAIIFMSAFPNSEDSAYLLVVGKVCIALVILGWPSLARLMRASVLQVLPNDYISAARAMGASPWRIIRSHIIPNSLTAMVVVCDDQPRGVHLGRGDAVLPRHRADAAGDLLGRDDQRRHRRAADHPAHAVLPERVPAASRCWRSSCSATPPATPSTRRRAERERDDMTTTSTAAERGTHYVPQDGVLLEVDDLHVEFHTEEGVARAINGVSFELGEGETLAVLGESGSGKSVTAQAIMGILDIPPARVAGGEIRYCGHDLLTMGEEERRRTRGPEISIIFQDALSSLNPVFPVGWQIAEMFRKHRGMNRSDALEQAVRLMDRVQIPGARQRVKAYPHQFSGGMRQRIMIAMAISLDPAVLIADEPTTALDVTVQAQIMALLQELQEEREMGLILITHDLGVVADVADRIAVMYAGRIVEQAEVREIYARPGHPYTKGLIDSIPRLDQKGQELYAIGGLPPNLTRMPPGCAFHPRCPRARDICVEKRPELIEHAPGRLSACHFAEEVLRG